MEDEFLNNLNMTDLQWTRKPISIMTVLVWILFVLQMFKILFNINLNHML